MGTFTKGEIVLFPFPYTDLTSRKLRPCLVLSDEMREDIILCQITSKATPKDEFTIELKQNETLDGSLMLDSYVRVNMLFTASKKQILRKVCSITDERYQLVVHRILEVMRK